MRPWPLHASALAIAACSPAPAPIPVPVAAPIATTSSPACATWPLPRGCARGLATSKGSLCALTETDAFCWPTAPTAGRTVIRQPLGAPDLELRRAGPRVVSDDISCAVAESKAGQGSARCEADRVEVQVDIGKSRATGHMLAPNPRLQVAAGDGHLCARTEGGAVWCSGSDRAGQLGGGGGRVDAPDGEPVHVDVPAEIDIAAIGDTTCVLSAEGEIRCWGAVSGFPPGARVPLAEARLTGWVIEGLPTGSETTCVLAEDGRVICTDWRRRVWFALRGVEGAVELAAQERAICARRGDGEVTCLTTLDARAARSAVLSPAKALVPGVDCAVKPDGVVRCEGAFGETGTQGVPTRDFTDLGPVRAVGAAQGAARASAACAVTDRGALRCWGGVGWRWIRDDKPPHPGPSLWMPGWVTADDVATNPIAMGGIHDVVELSAGGSCARTRDGQVYALTQRGPGKGGRHRLTPVTAKGAENATRLLAGNACAAARADGSVFLVPLDRAIPTAPAPRGPPSVVELPRLAGAVELEIGYRAACARLADGRARCIGPAPDDVRDVLRDDFTVALGDEPTAGVLVGPKDIVCALPRSGGLLCREAKDGAYGEPVNPIARSSALPVRVLPVE